VNVRGTDLNDLRRIHAIHFTPALDREKGNRENDKTTANKQTNTQANKQTHTKKTNNNNSNSKQTQTKCAQ
jgi:hypothetical protein